MGAYDGCLSTRFLRCPKIGRVDIDPQNGCISPRIPRKRVNLAFSRLRRVSITPFCLFDGCFSTFSLYIYIYNMCACVSGYGRVRGHRALRAHVATALVDRRRERNRPAPRTDTRRHRRAIAPHDLVLDQNPIKSGLCACQTSPTGTEGTRAAVHARDERPVYGTGRWRRAPSRATAAGDGVRTWSAVCRVTREPIYISGNY